MDNLKLRDIGIAAWTGVQRGVLLGAFSIVGVGVFISFAAGLYWCADKLAEGMPKAEKPMTLTVTNREEPPPRTWQTMQAPTGVIARGVVISADIKADGYHLFITVPEGVDTNRVLAAVWEWRADSGNMWIRERKGEDAQ